jgi:hypothetical protein
VHRAADHQCPAVDAPPDVAPQSLAELRQLEPAAIQLVKDTDSRERSQQPVERVGVRLRLGGELVGRPRSAGKTVADVEARRDVQRLRELVAGDQSEQRPPRIFVHAAILRRDQINVLTHPMYRLWPGLAGIHGADALGDVIGSRSHGV